MEHKLIQGGGQYLPFARSRLQQLRAEGHLNVVRSYQLPDAEIEVEICETEEYIRITSTGCVIDLDSGMVNLYTLLPQFTELHYLPSRLYETTVVSSYHAPFVPPQPGDAVRRNPGTTSDGQLAGSLRKGSLFQGGVPIDRGYAKSFSPKLETDNTVDPPVEKFATADDALLIKKLTAGFCPASMFTGRTRLYVQALYGRPLYKGGTAAEAPRPVTEGLTGRPALSIQSFRYPGEDDYGTVPITTNTGVFLDRATGKHWLINPGTANVYCTPLRGTACAEGMRKYLVQPLPAGVEALSEQDQQHLEAYILSVSFPDSKNVRLTATGADIDGSYLSCGYGWHWNLSGTAADIVINDTGSEADGIHEFMSSTHWRLQIAAAHETDGAAPPRIVDTTFHAVCLKLEGPVDWAPERDVWTICEPAWPFKLLQKTTPRRVFLKPCSAPFYAFYRGDDLQLCRFQLTETPPQPSTFDRDPFFYDETYLDEAGQITTAGQHVTVGLRSGYGEYRYAQPRYWEARISCGDVVHEKMFHGRSSQAWRTEVGSKQMTGEHTYGHFYNATFGAVYFYGYPDANGEYDSNTLPSYFGRAGYGRIGNHQVNFFVVFDFVDSKFVESYPCFSNIVIPLYDSEALYMRSMSHRDRVESSRVKTVNKSGFYVDATQFAEGYAGEGATSVSYSAGSWNYCYIAHRQSEDAILEPPTNQTPESSREDLLVSNVLVCRAGVLPVKDYYIVPSMKTSAEELVADNFKTLTSATGGVVIGNADKLDPIGVIGPVPEQNYEPALVGWT